MSDIPNRSITGLSPKSGSGDFSRLQRRNRPSAVPVQPVAAPPETMQLVPDLMPAVVPPAEVTPVREVVSERERVTTYLDAGLRSRAKEAYRATSHLEGDKSWSDFVERAILAEVVRREDAHNAGNVYAGDRTPLSPGRPLK